MGLVETIQAIQLVDRMRGDLLELQLSTFGGRHKPGRQCIITDRTREICHDENSLYVLGNFKSETCGPQVLGGNPNFEATPY